MGKPILYSLPSTWGLPSFHPDFLKVHTYMKLVGLQYKSEPTPTSANAALEAPVLEMGNLIVSGSEEIIQHLRVKGHDLDEHLSQQERAELFAFVSMIEGQLNAAMLYDWYMVEDNYHQVTLPLYTAACAFPARLLLPWQLSRRVKARLGYPTEEEGEAYYKQAESCYSALSARLGQGPFFFGDSPSTLDAVVFGHLAIHLYAPMPAPARLSTSLRGYKNLCDLIERISSRHMGVSLGLFTVKDTQKKEEEKAKEAKPQRTEKEKARRRRARDFIAGGVILTVAFIFFTNIVDVDAGGVDD